MITKKISNIKKIITEIRKCDVVCPNCHRIRTFNSLWGKNLPEIMKLANEKREEIQKFLKEP